jgi:hypothetical protein
MITGIVKMHAPAIGCASLPFRAEGPGHEQQEANDPGTDEEVPGETPAKALHGIILEMGRQPEILGSVPADDFHGHCDLIIPGLDDRASISPSRSGLPRLRPQFERVQIISSRRAGV